MTSAMNMSRMKYPRASTGPPKLSAKSVPLYVPSVTQRHDCAAERGKQLAGLLRNGICDEHEQDEVAEGQHGAAEIISQECAAVCAERDDLDQLQGEAPARKRDEHGDGEQMVCREHVSDIEFGQRHA